MPKCIPHIFFSLILCPKSSMLIISSYIWPQYRRDRGADLKRLCSLLNLHLFPKTNNWCSTRRNTSSLLGIGFYIYIMYNIYVASFWCLCFLKGHGIWLSRYENILFFNIPEPDGHVISPVLAGFYMFWTMIILLQVISIKLFIEF